MSETPAPPDGFVTKTAWSLSGMALWTAHFGLLYGGQHAACARGLASPGLITAFILGVTAICVLIAAALWLLARMRLSGFYKAVTGALLLLGVFGILAAGSAALILPDCMALR